MTDSTHTAGVGALGVDETTFTRANQGGVTLSSPTWPIFSAIACSMWSTGLRAASRRAGSLTAKRAGCRPSSAWPSTPCRGYHNALAGGLDAPEVFSDPFHISRLTHEAVDSER